jgi:hypothetical protein
MTLDRIVCLANSYKHDHRCVAGISLITKKWVRLVGRKVPGCLTIQETCYPDGKQAALLDVIEVELGEPCGSNCHPEDVFVTGKTWRPMRRFNEPQDIKFLGEYIEKKPIVLGGYSDRVPAERFEQKSICNSLGLVDPEDLWWWVREGGGKRRNRAVFRLGQAGRIRYDLAVTDPKWLEQLNLLPAGIHSHTLVMGGKHARTILTTSLSEPFEGFHYKLVASVLFLPPKP